MCPSNKRIMLSHYHRNIFITQTDVFNVEIEMITRGQHNEH